MPSLIKIVVPALAAAGSVQAACSASATTTIQNAGDATALSSCSTFSGSIAVATGTTDDIDLSGIKTLSGNLVARNNSQIKRISANDLEQISGELNLDGLTRLYGIDFPKVKKVDSIKWNALPNLQNIGFTAQVEEAKKVDIQNTGLRSLQGINIQKAETLYIANNGYINEINMQLGNISNSLTFADNNQAVAVSLPNLLWASNLTFRFCGSVSVPSLAKLNGSLGLYNNGFETFSAPNLTEVGEALAIVANDKLNNLTFPALTKINDNLQIANNSQLAAVDGLPELKSVGGAFDISGNMSKIESPKIESVKGTFNLQSTENITAACNFYKPLKDKKFIQGPYFCKGKVVDPGVAGTKPKDQSGSKSAATSLTAATGAFGFVAMVAVLLL